MPSLNLILDPKDDVNKAELVKLAQRYELPELVKKADIDATMNPQNIAVTSFADPVRKKFACQNAAATLLSAVYFHEKSAEYHIKDRQRIADRFEAFADYFAVRPAYDDIVKQAEALRGSNCMPDSNYAYVWESADGMKEQFYPLDTTANIKVAAEWLHKERDAIPYSNRYVIANKILEKAAARGAKLGDDLTDFVEKQAGRGIPNPDEVVTMLDRRAKLARTQNHRDAILKLAATVKSTPRIALQSPELVKLATTVDMIDHSLGIRGNYTDIVQRPEDVIFGVTYTKAASDIAQLCTLQTGNIYDKGQLSKLAKEDVEGLFGSDFAGEVCTGLEVDPEKLAEVAHTLPRPDAELLEQLLGEAGQQPQMNKGASWEPISDETLEELAEMYQ